MEFNWKILMALKRMVYCVVFHELSHLIHNNQSAAFWSEVERVMPGYEGCKEWLRQHAHWLEI